MEAAEVVSLGGERIVRRFFREVYNTFGETVKPARTLVVSIFILFPGAEKRIGHAGRLGVLQLRRQRLADFAAVRFLPTPQTPRPPIVSILVVDDGHFGFVALGVGAVGIASSPDAVVQGAVLGTAKLSCAYRVRLYSLMTELLARGMRGKLTLLV